MSRRAPSTPPQIPGHEYVRLLGMGGFADVFLYRQLFPERTVAVKVLVTGQIDDATRERFIHEANVMARLSSHPAILTIYHADLAPDGRPYIVMEYCEQGGLGDRYRLQATSVPDALRLGVRLAAAVETTHRSGLLHRDIKPANVLFTAYGWPALTDFGIAAATGSADAVGMSVPWAPPEVLGEHPSADERSDIYSLAATVYAAMAQRSPFDLSERRLAGHELVPRILGLALPPTGRPDVPDELERVLARAMAKDAADRHPSAESFARALQQVEHAMTLPVTHLELPDSPAQSYAPAEDADASLTRVRPVTRIGESAGTSSAASAHVGAPANSRQHTPTHQAAGSGPDADNGATVMRPPARIDSTGGAAQAGESGGSGAMPPRDASGARSGARPGPAPSPAPTRFDAPSYADAAPASSPARTGRRLAGIVAGVVVLAAAVTAGVLIFGRAPGTTPTPPELSPAPIVSASPSVAAGISWVPTPASLVGAIEDGTASFTWVNPDPQEGDTFLWRTDGPGAEARYEPLDSAQVSVPLDGASTVCIEVVLVRADRSFSSVPAAECAA